MPDEGVTITGVQLKLWEVDEDTIRYVYALAIAFQNWGWAIRNRNMEECNYCTAMKPKGTRCRCAYQYT